MEQIDPIWRDPTEEELRVLGWLLENEAILTRRMTRVELEDKYGVRPADSASLGQTDANDKD